MPDHRIISLAIEDNSEVEEIVRNPKIETTPIGSIWTITWLIWRWAVISGANLKLETHSHQENITKQSKESSIRKFCETVRANPRSTYKDIAKDRASSAVCLKKENGACTEYEEGRYSCFSKLIFQVPTPSRELTKKGSWTLQYEPEAIFIIPFINIVIELGREYFNFSIHCPLLTLWITVCPCVNFPNSHISSALQILNYLAYISTAFFAYTYLCRHIGGANLPLWIRICRCIQWQWKQLMAWHVVNLAL